MPTATPFKVLGVGDGFSTSQTTNINGLFRFTTASGVTSGSYNKNSINEDLRLCQKVYYNLYQISQGGVSSKTINVDGSVEDEETVSGGAVIEASPLSGVCGTRLGVNSEGRGNFSATIQLFPRITRFVDGGQLAGYGISLGSFSSIASRARAELSFSPFLNEDNTVSEEDREVENAQVIVDDINTICTAFGRTVLGGDSTTSDFQLNASSMEAQATLDRGSDISSGIQIYKAKIDSAPGGFSYWTY